MTTAKTQIHNFDDFLSLFPAHPREKAGNGVLVICPGHIDHNPSLLISPPRKDDYIVDWHCLAGCSCDKVLTALNLTREQVRRNNHVITEKRIIDTYSYTDIDGKEVYQVIRYEPKNFRQRRRGINGDYIWNLDGIEPTIYHLPDIVKAVLNGETIFILEGEQDCNCAWGNGLIATCNSGGAGKFKAEFARYFSGAKQVVVIADKDDAGRNHAHKVCQSLKGKVKSLKYLELPGDHVKDFTDWITNGGDDLQLMALVEASPEYKPEPPTSVNNSSLFINNINKIQGNYEPVLENSLETGQSTGQSPDNRGTKGALSIPFDQFLSENPEPHWKREVAEIIGTTYKDESFIRLVHRRKKEGAIRILHGGDKIQWINREWQNSIVQLSCTTNTFTDLLLPFNAERYIAIPEHSQIVVAGDVGSGKTHLGYEIADLNVGKMPIRHFFNEIGASKAKRNLEDYPNLSKHYGDDYFLIDLDKEGIDVGDNLDPNGLNIFDYLHLSSSKEWFLKLQEHLTILSQRLERGVICVMLQKRRGQNLGMGGDSTRMQCEVYFTLNIERDTDSYKECRIDIIKAKDWVTSVNPEILCCRYKTAPRWGKLVENGEWERKPQL